MVSCRTMAPASAPKTDSSDRITAASDAEVYFCPTLWSKNARPEGKIPRKAMPDRISGERLALLGKGSKTSETTHKNTLAKANWSIVIRKTSSVLV